MEEKIDWKLIGLIGFFLLVFLIIFFLNNHTIYVVRSDSMLPTFTECTILLGDKVVLPQSVQNGDIIVIDISDQNAEFDEIAHRVVENNTEAQTIATRGDNNSYYDFPSSIDGLFSYSRFRGRIEWYYNLPNFLCKEI